jgi:hypothetical protein
LNGIGRKVLVVARQTNLEVIDDAMADVLRRKTGTQRLQIVDALYRAAWKLIEANIRANHADWDDARVRRAVAARISGGTD